LRKAYLRKKSWIAEIAVIAAACVPAVLAAQKGLCEPRYPSLKGIMAAKKKPLDVKTIADLGLSGQVGAANAKIAIEKVSMPQKGESAELVTGSVDEMATGLLSKIKELGLL